MTHDEQGDRPTVLLIDDDPSIVELYETYLTDEFTVRTATSGTDGLEKFDSDVDVVLLDRRMPDLSGDNVLERIREQDTNCAVAMVTAIEPDFDIIEMGFDDYLEKPVSRAALVETINRLVERTQYDANLQRLFALVQKRATLESQKSDADLHQHPEYQDLVKEIETLNDDVDDFVTTVNADEYKAILRGDSWSPESSS